MERRNTRFIEHSLNYYRLYRLRRNVSNFIINKNTQKMSPTIIHNILDRVFQLHDIVDKIHSLVHVHYNIVNR